MAKKMNQKRAFTYIKTACGRAKYVELAAHTGLLSQLRLFWFVFFASLRDWNANQPNQNVDSAS